MKITSDHLRGLLHTQPFRSFTISMVDGKKFRVPHEDFLTVTRQGDVLFQGDRGSLVFINPLTISHVSVSERQAA